MGQLHSLKLVWHHLAQLIASIFKAFIKEDQVCLPSQCSSLAMHQEEAYASSGGLSSKQVWRESMRKGSPKTSLEREMRKDSPKTSLEREYEEE